jgi:hypothetical protein
MRRTALSAGPLAAVVALLATSLGSAHPLPGAPKCQIFPPNNAWNQRVDRLPASKDSARMIASIGAGVTVHPDFGTRFNGAPNGIPFTIVSNRTRKVPVRFGYASESDGGPYPIPANARIEAGSDRHVILIDKDTCKLYELFSAFPHNGGLSWTAGSGAIFNLNSNHLRPSGWTSADAAGLPILPGLARYDEAKLGVIDHALRFTAKCTAPRYVYPARHQAGSCSTGPPMGLRVRLKAGIDISRLPPQARVVAKALKQYGLILADNGSNWYISGAPDPRWSDDQLHQLGRLSGRDFEVVTTSSLPHPS